MGKFWLGIIFTAILTAGAMGGSTIGVAAEESNDVTLTEEQKQEISGLQKNVIEQKKEIINKYVEYGVFTEEKGQKIISHLDQYYSKLEQNGFIPKWDKSKKHREHHNRDS